MSGKDLKTFQEHPNGPLTDKAIDRLKAIKDNTGMSYASLGEKVGLSGTFVYNLMNKKMNVGTQHIRRMMDAVAKLENDPSAATDELGVADGAGSLSHTFHLRPTFKVEMDLPTDITAKEAERLSLFIRSLPVE